VSKGKPPNRLREWRLARGHSLESVAADLSIGLTSLQRYETGDRPLTVETLEKLATYYLVGPGDLLNRPAHAGAISKEHELLETFRLLSPVDQQRLVGFARVMGEASKAPANTSRRGRV